MVGVVTTGLGFCECMSLDVAFLFGSVVTRFNQAVLCSYGALAIERTSDGMRAPFL